MKQLTAILFVFICFISCAQHKNPDSKPAISPTLSDLAVGGSCEGCDAIFESPVPFDSINYLCWLPDWDVKLKRLAINGIVYNSDSTPAANVVLYIYHTDKTGNYPLKGNETGWAKKHGYLRGWIKTNEKGEYKFFTLMPAPYPGRTDPAHIHITVKEPGKTAYWIDEYVFDNDSLLTIANREKLKNRGGSGIIKLFDTGDILKGQRNIYLGKNIPGYPVK